MKKIKRILSLSLAAIMLLVMMSVPSFAAGETITIKQTSDTVSMDGQTFYAYKIFDVTHSGSNYAYVRTANFVGFHFAGFPASGTSASDADIANDFADLLTTNSSIATLGTELHKYISDGGIIADGSVTGTSANTATINVSASGEGYYLVMGKALAPSGGTVITACTLVNVDPTGTVNLKADAPTVKKEVLENAPESWGTDADYKIGDKVPFNIVATIPDYAQLYDGEYKFIIIDEMSNGLTYNDDVKVYKYDRATGTSGAALTAADYTEVHSPQDIKVTIASNYIKTAVTGKAIYVEYTATLNNNAIVSTPSGLVANTNTVHIEYSRNPHNASCSPGETPEETVNVYTYSFDIFKYYEELGVKKPLAGAEFKIYSDAGCTTEVPLYTTTTAGIYSTTGSAVATVTSLGDGTNLEIKGLDKGTYWLKETKAPAGFYTASNIKIEIIPNVTASTLEIKADGTADADGVIEVLNDTSPRMPETGGIGTKMFYLFGGLLMVGAAVTLITRRRVHGQEK